MYEMKKISKPNHSLEAIFWVAAVVLFVLPFLALPTKVSAESALGFTEFSFYPAGSDLQDIALGPDGKLWFTISSTNKIGRITPNGSVVQFSVPSISLLSGITSGPDGNLWFTEYSTYKIGRITPSGSIVEFTIPSHTNPHEITTGPDGNIWFTEFDKIGRITPSGSIAEFSIPTDFSSPQGIVSGSDGNLWFVEFNGKKIGRITPTGIVTEFSLPTGSAPKDIVLGSDGNLWFTGLSSNQIGRITPDGIITGFPIPTIASGADKIILGTDGKLWFIESSVNKIGSITISGEVEEFSFPYTAYDITLGPYGNIWFTEWDRIGRIDLFPTPTNAPTALSDFKQTDPRWSTAPPYSPNNVILSTRLEHSGGCGNMWGFGCAVTSVANVFYSYGMQFLSSNNLQLTPGNLNDWLSDAANKGFTSCSIYWGNASAAVRVGAPIMAGRKGNDVDWNVGRQAIDNALSSGNLPIVGIKTVFGTHYIALSQKLPDVNGRPDYKIVDPALYPFSSNNPGKTGQSLSQAYGGFDNIFQAIIYRKGSTPQKTLTIGAHSPVQLLITDPQGNQTGYVESTGGISENIPESFYGVEPGIAPVDGQSPASDETKYFQQINPSVGEYIVKIIGTGDGSYTLNFSKTDEQASVSTQIVKGYTKKGTTETYHIQYSPDATEPPVAKKEVTFSILKSDLQKLYEQKLIDNKGIYLSLDVQVDLAIKAEKLNTKLGDRLAITLLKTFLLELKAQRGKHVKEDAYQILNYDADYLLKSLSGVPAPTPTPTPPQSGS